MPPTRHAPHQHTQPPNRAADPSSTRSPVAASRFVPDTDVRAPIRNKRRKIISKNDRTSYCSSTENLYNMILQFDIHLDGFDLYHFQIISFRCKYCAINANSLFRCIFLFHNCFAYQNIYSIHHRKNTLRFFRCHTITILWTFLLGKVQFSQEARCTSWPELITQAAVISRKAFNVKLGLRRPVGDRGANRGCVCLIYNSRASQPALANVYTPFFFQN